eukprot:1143642-Pelagomonas_calceolata.AAC.4
MGSPSYTGRNSPEIDGHVDKGDSSKTDGHVMCLRGLVARILHKMSHVKLKKFLLRYYPPGIILQYERDGVMKQKPVDLLDLGPGVDIEVARRQSASQANDCCCLNGWLAGIEISVLNCRHANASILVAAKSFSVGVDGRPCAPKSSSRSPW